KQLFVGKGAGSYPTGSAVLSDVSALTYDYMYEYKRHHREHDVEFSRDIILDAFVSFDVNNPVDRNSFEKISETGEKSLSGKIHLNNLQKLSKQDGVSIILNPA